MSDIDSTTFAQVERLKQAAAIVRAVAAQNAPIDGELGFCYWCDNGKMDNWKPEDHDPDCPWRRAREWMEA